MQSAVGVPIFIGTPAREVEASDLKSLVLEGDAHGVFELGRCNAGSFLTTQSYTLTDTLYQNDSAVQVKITGASPLHLAVQLCDPDVVAALLVLDPDLLHGTAVLEIPSQGSVKRRTITPLDMALVYSKQKGADSEMLCALLVNWNMVVHMGFFQAQGSAAARIRVLGCDTNIALDTMGILSMHKFSDIMNELVDADMYMMVLAQCIVPDMCMELEACIASATVSVPEDINAAFTGFGENASVVICNMNILHRALIGGQYEAAAALLVACPALVSYKTKIKRRFDCPRSFRASCSMLITMFPNDQSEQARIACFKIVRLAETNIDALEPLGLCTRSERIAAAGGDAQALFSRWTAIAENIMP